MRFRLYPDWRDLPAGYADLFARAGADDFCLSRAWFEAFAATVLGTASGSPSPASRRTRLPGMPLACLVGRHRERDPAFLGARSFSSLSNYYTLRYAPLVDGGDGRAALAALIEGLRARRPRYAVLHFEPLAADAALSDDLAAALRGAGLLTRRYFRFGNWYDDTRGLSFRDYLARRPAALRNTFRRNSARLAGAGVRALRRGAGRRCARGRARSLRAGLCRQLEAERAVPGVHPPARRRSRGCGRLATWRAVRRPPAGRGAGLGRPAGQGDPLQARPRPGVRFLLARHGADHAHARAPAR